MRSIQTNILTYLSSHPEGADDDELAAALSLRYRQQANDRCNQLAGRGLIERRQVNGKYRNFPLLQRPAQSRPSGPNPGGQIHVRCRQLMVEVMEEHLGLLGIAARQRAKFEGWLKFELALRMEMEFGSAVQLEEATGTGRCRSDISFRFGDNYYHLELKTPNTNWQITGVQNAHRPVTKNIASIVTDALMIRDCGAEGLVAFVLFPIPCGASDWHVYLQRISEETGIDLSEQEHCSRVTIPLSGAHSCEAIACCFPARAGIDD